MRIFVMGLPGVGKTTFAKQLAQVLSVKFIDLDELITNKVGMSISDYFSVHGENAFRQEESSALKETITGHDSFVLATGGGAPCFGDNLKTMLAEGVCILLKADINVIAQRILQNPDDRPMFLGLSKEEIEKKLSDLWDNRKTYYEQTHIITGVEAVEKPQLLTKRLELFTKKGNSLIDIIEID